MPANRTCGGCAIALAVVVAAVGALVYYTLYGLDGRVRRVEEVERWTHVRFPAGTKLLTGKTHEGTEAYLNAQLTIPRRSAKQFVSQFSHVSRDGKVISAYDGRTMVEVELASDTIARVKVEYYHP